MRQVSRNGLERVESLFDRAFGPAWNPLYYLGALGYFFYWIVAVTGIYLFIFFDTGITNAYESVEYITRVQWYAGGVMRSLHRYASDAMLLVMMVHLLREFIMDRYRGPRWFAWFTGVPMLWFIFACGISGYWLVWDKLAQYVAIATTEWLDALPIFGQSVARNFLSEATLSDRFFTLMVLIHILVPLILLFIMWIHIQRTSWAKVNPPRGLALGALATMLALALAQPVLSQGPADLGRIPAIVQLDWFYLSIYPLMDIFSGGQIWALVAICTLLLSCMPWLPPKRREPVAVVSLDNCNGCGRCVADCPFAAVTMQPRSDDHPGYTHEAVVDASLCESCGICVGSCPSATPFRKSSNLVTGIDLPDFSLRGLKEKTLEATEALTGNNKVLVYGCDFGPDLGALRGPDTAVVTLPCIALLPPSFLDFVITKPHADGVFLTGCREGACHHRLGIEWTDQRIAGERDPYLRTRVPRDRVGRSWAGHAPPGKLARDLEAFRASLKTAEPLKFDHPKPNARPVKVMAGSHG